MGQCHRQSEREHAQQRHLPAHGEDQPGGRRDSLAALEIHVKRKIVTKYHARCCINRKQRQHIRILSGKKCVHDKHRDHALKCIAEQRDRPGLRPERAEHIRRPRVSASAFSDVDPVQLSVNIAGLKQPKHIAYDNTNQPFHVTSRLSPSALE